MRFLVDMGISPESAAFLRRRGADVLHLSEEGLARLADPDILIKARTEGRILLTHDLNFGELLAIAGTSLPSVIIFRLRNMCPNVVNRYLQGVLTEHSAILESGAIMSVTEGRVRVRTLPLTVTE